MNPWPTECFCGNKYLFLCVLSFSPGIVEIIRILPNAKQTQLICTQPIPWLLMHYNDVIMKAMASEITDVSIVCSTVCSGADRRKHQSSPSRAFVRGVHRWPVDSPHKGPVTRSVIFDSFNRQFMLTSSSRNTTRFTGPLWGESTRSHGTDLAFSLYIPASAQEYTGSTIETTFLFGNLDE